MQIFSVLFARAINAKAVLKPKLNINIEEQILSIADLLVPFATT